MESQDRGACLPGQARPGVHGIWWQQDIPGTEGRGQGVPELGEGSLLESVKDSLCTEGSVRTLTLRTVGVMEGFYLGTAGVESPFLFPQENSAA